MRKLVYALKFYRPPADMQNSAPLTTAQSMQITTTMGPEGVQADFHPVPGETATLTNQFVLNNDGLMFFEWGSIQFGSQANTLTFSSINAGVLLGAPDADGMSHGTVMWKIDSGTGVFADATGAITSNFLVNQTTGELMDYQFHLLYLP